jgi:hypothetical protein
MQLTHQPEGERQALESSHPILQGGHIISNFPHIVRIPLSWWNPRFIHQ